MKVLFLCTGNSCRSQMAEGWARALGYYRRVRDEIRDFVQSLTLQTPPTDEQDKPEPLR